MVELRCPQEPITPNASLRVIRQPKVTEGRALSWGDDGQMELDIRRRGDDPRLRIGDDLRMYIWYSPYLTFTPSFFLRMFPKLLNDVYLTKFFYNKVGKNHIDIILRVLTNT